MMTVDCSNLANDDSWLQ